MDEFNLVPNLLSAALFPTLITTDRRTAELMTTEYVSFIQLALAPRRLKYTAELMTTEYVSFIQLALLRAGSIYGQFKLMPKLAIGCRILTLITTDRRTAELMTTEYVSFIQLALAPSRLKLYGRV
ncbi:hypothetical protein J6590_101170 [Homalodisca vitripennis]|nr:hypothetical protein J6590_101170 [Homalodisca vitripennis]